MRRAALAAVLLSALAACGSSAGVDCGAAGSDGGVAGADGSRADAGGWRSFEVTATLKVTPTAGDEGSWAEFPKTAKLTVVWNEAEGLTATGANGVFGQGAVTPADAGSHRTGTWAAAVPFTGGCGGTATIFLDDVTFTVVGGAILGSATGRARYITSGAETIEAPVAATLAGVPDVTPPVLSLGSAAPAAGVDPLAALVLGASEPVPAIATQTLAGTPSGVALPLTPVTFQQIGDLAIAFAPLGTSPQYGQTYTLVSHLTDPAGNAVAPLTFTTRAAPPLVPEDGFESVTGTMFAGAGVLRGGPLMPISGQTSLLLNTGFGGGFGFLPYDLGPSFAVRLAAPPDAHVVRFSYQLIAPDSVDSAAFDGVVRAGWPGVGVAESTDLGATQFTRTTLPTLGDIFLSPVRTVELTLPAGQGSEIAFEIVGRTFACMRPPSPTVLVIDDLRVE